LDGVLATALGLDGYVATDRHQSVWNDDTVSWHSCRHRSVSQA